MGEPCVACVSHDEYECWARRYHLRGWDHFEVDLDGGPCECGCHDDDDDWPAPTKEGS